MADQNSNALPPETVQGVDPDEEFDASIQADIDMSGTENPNAMNFDGAGDAGPSGPDIDPVAAAVDPRLPTKKDASLREFLGKMDDYAPIVSPPPVFCECNQSAKTNVEIRPQRCIPSLTNMFHRQIPDAVTNYYLTLAGLPPPPQTSTQLARLLALATQKFISDIAADAYQYSRIRSSNTSSNNPMGALGAATGFPAQGQSAPSGAAGGAGGKEGGAQQGKGGPLGVQRPGFGGGGQGGGQGRTVLTMEDLGMAVGEYGVNIKRGEFYR
jgi:transcription initiation factor TFIID subunit 10